MDIATQAFRVDVLVRGGQTDPLALVKNIVIHRTIGSNRIVDDPILREKKWPREKFWATFLIRCVYVVVT